MGWAQHGHAHGGVGQEHPLDASAGPSVASGQGGRCRRDLLAPAAPSGLRDTPIAVVFQCPLVPKHRGVREGLSPEKMLTQSSPR